VSALLEVSGLSTQYVGARGTRVTRAVDDVTFTLEAGRTLGIVGESGSGKTTLALTLMRLLPPAARIAAGSVRFEGEELLSKSDAQMRAIRGKRMAMILQDPMASLNPLFTVGDQIAETLRAHETTTRRAAWARARGLLAAVNIAAPERRVSEFPHELSGGMRQRVAICRALVYDPELLLMDEPFAAVDAQTRADLEDLIRALWRRLGVTILFVTHDIDEAVYLGQRVIVLSVSPTEVQTDLPVNLPDERDQLSTRSDPRFATLRAQVYALIQRAKRGDRPV